MKRRGRKEGRKEGKHILEVHESLYLVILATSVTSDGKKCYIQKCVRTVKKDMSYIVKQML